MERTLQDIEDLRETLEIKHEEAQLKQRKQLMRSNKKIKREEAMRK